MWNKILYGTYVELNKFNFLTHTRFRIHRYIAAPVKYHLEKYLLNGGIVAEEIYPTSIRHGHLELFYICMLWQRTINRAKVKTTFGDAFNSIREQPTESTFCFVCFRVESTCSNCLTSMRLAGCPSSSSCSSSAWRSPGVSVPGQHFLLQRELVLEKLINRKQCQMSLFKNIYL